jgi:hypothetical protein
MKARVDFEYVSPIGGNTYVGQIAVCDCSCMVSVASLASDIKFHAESRRRVMRKVIEKQVRRTRALNRLLKKYSEMKTSARNIVTLRFRNNRSKTKFALEKEGA